MPSPSRLPQRLLRKVVRPLTRSASTAPAPAPAPSPSPSTSSYTPPLQPGQLPAYDEALKYIEADRLAKLKQLEELKKGGEAVESELYKLEVEAWVNDPETRWRAKEGLGDLSKPVFRHLAERAWRQDGPLAILMQRVTQMHVTPDLLPEIDPEVNVQIRIAEEVIVPGVFTTPTQTKEGVEIRVQVYHLEEKLYTLVLVDPDVPNEMEQSFTTYAHWLIPNIPLSCTSSPTITSSSPSLLSYIPPHPQEGTPYHRYTILLLAQTRGKIELVPEMLEREGFSIREFAKDHSLEAKGVSFWRQVWDKSVSDIYRDTLSKFLPFTWLGGKIGLATDCV